MTTTTTLTAGPDLDVRIATEVLGWQIAHTLPNGQMLFRIPIAGSSEFYYDDPPFSSDIKKAWLVVEHLRAQGYYIAITCGDASHWEASLDRGRVLLVQSAPTAPLAICKVALETVRV